MGNTLYLECYSGISGDMTVGALLDLGADEQVLRKALSSLPIQGFEIEISRVKKSGLDACDFLVKLDAEHENHDHDMHYLHGGEHDHHHHGEGHDHHHHGEGHDHHHHHEEDRHHPHEHRGMPEITEIIQASGITPRAKELALRIFGILAEAEASVHGVPVEDVHFHEVGAVDSIVDIVAVAVCLDNLNITEGIVSSLYEGMGTVRCQHGMMPIPVPAVAGIAKQHQLILHPTEVAGELVTPTGAAIAAAIRTKEHLPEQYSIEGIGMGAGKREYATAGILRAMILK